MTIASQIVNKMPKEEVPERTTGYQGFFHLHSMEGSVEQSTLQYIVRDHDSTLFEERKQFLVDLVADMNRELGEELISLELKDQYFNMKEKIEPMMHIIDIAKEVMMELGIKPDIKAIRGGTDGSQLSYMGLPCPNIFAGGHNFHGRYEYIPIPSLVKAAEVIVGIAEKTALR